MSVVKRFSDFADEPQPIEGDKVKIDDILNQEIIITAYDIKISQFKKNVSGKYLTIQFKKITDDNKLYIVFTGSDVLINQLEKYADEIPFSTFVKRVNRYYTLTQSYNHGTN